eukprot:scaffold22307_cov126-Isochrysis_galbana.AAC.2
MLGGIRPPPCTRVNDGLVVFLPCRGLGVVVVICHCLVIDRTVRMVATGCSAAHREDSPFVRPSVCVCEHRTACVELED